MKASHLSQAWNCMLCTLFCTRTSGIRDAPEEALGTSKYPPASSGLS